MALLIICDECGASQQVKTLYLERGGRAAVGTIHTVSVDLCPEHYPDTASWSAETTANWQPRNCTKVRFYFPPEYPPRIKH